MWETKAQMSLLPEGSLTVFVSPGQAFHCWICMVISPVFCNTYLFHCILSIYSLFVKENINDFSLMVQTITYGAQNYCLPD